MSGFCNLPWSWMLPCTAIILRNEMVSSQRIIWFQVAHLQDKCLAYCSTRNSKRGWRNPCAKNKWFIAYTYNMFRSARSIQLQGKLQHPDIKMTIVWKDKMYKILLVKDRVKKGYLNDKKNWEIGWKFDEDIALLRHLLEIQNFWQVSTSETIK